MIRQIAGSLSKELVEYLKTNNIKLIIKQEKDKIEIFVDKK